MKNEKEVKKAKKKEQEKNAPKKSSAFSVFSKILLVVLVVIVCIGIYCLAQTIKYKEYTDQMYLYKYNEFYSNEKATAYQSVSNLDMIKVLLGSLNNASNLDNLALVTKTEEMTDEDVWYETAKKMNLTLRMEQNDMTKKATKIDAVITAMRLVEACIRAEVELANLNMSKDRLGKFAASDADYIAKAVTLGIIENDDSALSSKKINKGELNKLVIEICNKYATVYYKDMYVNEEGKLVKNDVQIVTDEESLPTNSKEYPYIVSNIEKSEYEIPLIVENERDFKNSKEVFAEMGKLYGQIDDIVTGYLDTLLNVDYKTIDYINFKRALNKDTIYKLNDDMVEMYVEYVLDNKITLKGETEILLPILYYTGERYCVRTKITIDVINSTTNKNLLYGDSGNDVEYNGEKITMYVDVPLSMTLNSKSLYVEPTCLATRIVGKAENIKVPEVQGGIIYEENK